MAASNSGSIILYFALVVFLVGPSCAGTPHKCDSFIDLTLTETLAYQSAKRVYPVPVQLQQLAIQYMPRLWTHPDSGQPIDFDQYLRQATVYHYKGSVLAERADVPTLQAMSVAQQCDAYLDAPDVVSGKVAPVYIQAFQDRSPGSAVSGASDWTYFKYNFVFDWSGLPYEHSIVASIGAAVTGGEPTRWHRLDIHGSVVLAFDPKGNLRTLTLLQHHYQKTFLAGRDFPAQAPQVAAARYSNELYLDDGAATPHQYRVVTFLDNWEYLMMGTGRPLLWSEDHVYGRGAGAQLVALTPVFIVPQHPLARFAGTLGPPKRRLGMYVGRDGPPGFDFYALPEFTPLPNLVAMGYWHEGNQAEWNDISPKLRGWKDSDWPGIVRVLGERLDRDLVAYGVDGSRP